MRIIDLLEDTSACGSSVEGVLSLVVDFDNLAQNFLASDVPLELV